MTAVHIYPRSLEIAAYSSLEKKELLIETVRQNKSALKYESDERKYNRNWL